MSWRLWKEAGLASNNPVGGKSLILSTGFGTVPLIADGGDVHRGVSLSTFPTSLSSVLLPYALKPYSFYFYTASGTCYDIHLCICLYPPLG